MAKKSVAQVTFEANTKQFDDAIKDSNRELGELRGELRLNAEEMKTTGETAEGMKKKHDLLEAQLKATHDKTEALSQKLEEAQRIFGDNSEAVSKLKGQLNNAKIAEEKAKQAINDCNDELKDTKKATKDAGDGFTVMKGVVADLASSAIQAAIGKISEFCGWLAQLPEETREIRQDMVTLETSFETAGLTVEQGTETWKQLYRVFGEDDRAVEASNLISKMSKNQKDLNKWVTITKGVYGQFQDSLPVEGLAEASMETAKTGTVTGNLADALNWSSEAADMFSKYMSDDVTTAEDAFNVALSKCSNEQERQALITETLTKLYGDSAAKFEEASGAQLDAKEKTAENILVQNELADTMEPLTTSWQGFKNELLVGVLPVVEKVSGWGVSAIEWMQKHPTAMKAIAAAVGVLAVGLGALAIAAGVYTAAQWAMNAAILANPITWIVVAIVAAIAALTAVFVVLWNKCEGFRNFFIDMWAKIKTVWDACKPYFEAIGMALKTVFSIVGDFLIAKFKMAWEGIKLAWSVAASWFKTCWENIKQVFSVVKVYLAGMFESAWAAIQLVWSVVVGYFLNIWNTIKGIFSVAKNVLSGNWQGAWDAIKNIVSGWASYFNDIWANIKNVFSTVKSWFSDTFKAAWSAIKNIWSNVGSFFSGVIDKVKGVFSKAKDIITQPFKTAIDKIKGFFSGLKLKFPDIKLPHFKIEGKFSLSPPSVPKLKIDWYKDGGIMTKPTIFGFNGNRIMAGGEAGAEAILPIDRLEGYVSNAVEKTMRALDVQTLAAAMNNLANRPTKLYINGKEFAYATASDMDGVNGMRNTLADIGLILE